jgi:hypothetical protein
MDAMSIALRARPASGRGGRAALELLDEFLGMHQVIFGGPNAVLDQIGKLAIGVPLEDLQRIEHLHVRHELLAHVALVELGALLLLEHVLGRSEALFAELMLQADNIEPHASRLALRAALGIAPLELLALRWLAWLARLSLLACLRSLLRLIPIL